MWALKKACFYVIEFLCFEQLFCFNLLGLSELVLPSSTTSLAPPWPPGGRRGDSGATKRRKRLFRRVNYCIYMGKCVSFLLFLQVPLHLRSSYVLQRSSVSTIFLFRDVLFLPFPPFHCLKCLFRNFFSEICNLFSLHLKVDEFLPTLLVVYRYMYGGNHFLILHVYYLLHAI